MKLYLVILTIVDNANLIHFLLVLQTERIRWTGDDDDEKGNHDDDDDDDDEMETEIEEMRS